MDAEARAPHHLGNPKTEELDVPWEFNTAFGVVHFELHAVSQEPGDRSEDAFPGSSASDEDHDVVGVAHKAQAAFFEFLIEFVEHV